MTSVQQRYAEAWILKQAFLEACPSAEERLFFLNLYSEMEAAFYKAASDLFRFNPPWARWDLHDDAVQAYFSWNADTQDSQEKAE